MLAFDLTDLMVPVSIVTRGLILNKGLVYSVLFVLCKSLLQTSGDRGWVEADMSEGTETCWFRGVISQGFPRTCS
jgi:hypothetical protein